MLSEQINCIQESKQYPAGKELTERRGNYKSLIPNVQPGPS